MGAPIDMIKHQVRASIIELVTRTAILTRDVYVDTQCDVGDYDLTLDDGYVIRSIKSVCLGACELRPLTDLPCGDHGPNGYYFERPCQLVVTPKPSSDCQDGITVKAVVAPSHQSCLFDKWLYEYYAEDIATGALSRLMIMKGANWYDTKQGGIMLRRWKGVLANIKTEKSKNFTSRPTIIQVKRWI
jgi:hypothetical protein